MAKKKAASSSTRKKPTDQQKPTKRVEMAPTITVPIRAYHDAGYALGMYGCGEWSPEAAQKKLRMVSAHLLDTGLAEGEDVADVDGVIAIALNVLAGYVKARNTDTEEMCRILKLKP